MVKEKPNSIRTYDKDGYRLRAACVCVKDDSEQEILLVSASRNHEHWIVPGGGIEPTEDTGIAALREVKEEAGAKGALGRYLGVFENAECKTRTSVYVMIVDEVLDDWEDRSIGRRRKWFTVMDAIQQLRLHRPEQSSYLDLLKHSANNASSSSSSR